MAKKKKAAKAANAAKPVILITNDDGITAPGIHNLVEAINHNQAWDMPLP